MMVKIATVDLELSTEGFAMLLISIEKESFCYPESDLIKRP